MFSTDHNARPLHVGDFADAYDRFRKLDPAVADNVTRMRIYNLFSFARMSLDVPGDFVFAGVARGVAPRVLYELLPARAFYLIDAFTGVNNVTDKIVLDKYSSDPDAVRAQYPEQAAVEIVVGYIPQCLPLSNARAFAFVHMNTGDGPSEAAAFPSLYKNLSPGGYCIIDNYAISGGYFDTFDPVFSELGVEPYWLPTGQCVIKKPAL